MAITKQKKKETVEKISKALKSAETAVFVNFKGLKVADATSLRKSLRGAGVGYVVAKKTLIKRALADKKVEGDLPNLEGEIALAYGEDKIAPAREVFAFEQKLKDSVKIAGGIFSGHYEGRDKMLQIAKIPTLSVLRGMFLNIINSPMERVVIALSEVSKLKESKG